MGAYDKKHTQLEKRSRKRAFEQEQRMQKEEQRKSEYEEQGRLVKIPTVKKLPNRLMLIHRRHVRLPVESDEVKCQYWSILSH